MPSTREVQRAYYQKNKERIKAQIRGYYAANPEPVKARAAKWRKDNPDRYKEIMRKCKAKRLLNGAEPDRPRPDTCECCGGPPSKNTAAMYLDHDHKTGEFRGWLCHKCNSGIGSLGDDLVGVQRAVNYLLKNAKPNRES